MNTHIIIYEYFFPYFQLTRSDGRDVNLTEDPDLNLPFLLPEDGYSCDVVHGVPSGLTEFVQTLLKDRK